MTSTKRSKQHANKGLVSTQRREILLLYGATATDLVSRWNSHAAMTYALVPSGILLRDIILKVKVESVRLIKVQQETHVCKLNPKERV